jgi:diguanylate cyclase (GGDEF)-like protein/PAS domain S-box-containing protein
LIGTLLVTVALAFFLGPRLQQPISRPLVELVQTADAISHGADYSLRASSTSRDEFGMLVSAFNGMLQQIQSRNDQLRKHREHLEDEVQSRTLNAASNSIVITDFNGQIVWSNPAFSISSGFSSEEVLGKSPALVKSGKHGKEFYSQMWATILSGNTWRGEVINRRKNGELYPEEMTVTPVTSQPGEITHFVAIKQDITDRKRAAEALSLAEEKYRAIFEGAVVGIFQINPDGRPISINRALAQMHGYDSPDEFMSEVSNVTQQLFVDPDRMITLKRELERASVVQGVELEIYRKDRTKKWVVANIRAAKDASGAINLYEGTMEDITDRKVAEERVQFLAYYDALTGLPNRILLQDRINTALASARRRKERVAVLFLDLDRFKIINDSLGHSTGDLLLQEVASRLKGWAREQDTVARVGGDEFVVLLTSMGQESDAAVAAQRIIKALSVECSIRGQSLSITTSIGISIFPQNGIDGETLIKHADTAMYCAKQKGPNNVQFFTEDLNSQMVERLTLESGLRLAIDRKEFFLVYQPQIDMATGRIVGYEALLRWNQPVLGLVPPDKFIRIAENSGLIVPIGEWVLRTACSQARRWRDEGLPAVRIAVNVSAVQFRQDGFRDLIRDVLRETGLAPEYLELELTESLLLTNADVVFSVLQELNEMGLNLAIDDFGTGYSSLSYLKQFRVNKLKIDRSFIRDIAVDSDDAAITTAIISMAKSLNLKVIAEGVETEEQMSFLRLHQCDEIQGYYFSKPLLPEDAAEKLRSTSIECDLPSHSAGFIQAIQGQISEVGASCTEASVGRVL